MEKEKTKIVSIRLPEETADFYERKAKESGLSRSAFLALALQLGAIIIDDDIKDRKSDEFFDAFAEGVKNAVQKR